MKRKKKKSEVNKEIDSIFETMKIIEKTPVEKYIFKLISNLNKENEMIVETILNQKNISVLFIKYITLYLVQCKDDQELKKFYQKCILPSFNDDIEKQIIDAVNKYHNK